MNNRNLTRDDFFILVSGFNKDTQRNVFRREFQQFGVIKKIFLEKTGKYAKIYFVDKLSCETALQTFRNNLYNWKVEYVSDRDQLKLLQYNCSNGSINMDDEGDLIENFGYCTIHGQPLVVLQSDSGDLYVKLQDIRRTGFRIFRKDTFSHLLVDRDQINKEFELHLLSEAKNYILNNKVATIDEDKILETIERCKSKLVSDSNPNSPLFPSPGRSVVPKNHNNFQITTDLQNCNDERNSNVNNLASVLRSPKMLPTNFMATNSYAQDAKKQPSVKKITGNIENGLQSLISQSSIRQNKKENKQMNRSEEDCSPKVTEHTRSKVKHNFEDSEEISSISLNPGDYYNVKVCFLESEKICWVQVEDSFQRLEDMTLELFEIESKLDDLEYPSMGQLVIAFYEQLWYRARVISEEPLLVHYLDYGNKNKPDVVKILPEKYKKTPAMACRVVVNLGNCNLSDGLEMNVKIKQKYKDGTYLCQMLGKTTLSQPVCAPNTELFQGSEELVEDALPPRSPHLNVVDNNLESHADKVYLDIPLPLAELQDGEMIIIYGILDDNKLLVKTKDCCKMSKDLIEYIKKLDKSILTMTSVEKNQLVLCSKDGMVGMYRATVIATDNKKVATVRYIDYPGEDQLSLKSLRKVDEYLAKQPALMLETPVYESLVDAVPTALDFVGQLIEDKIKVTVMLSESKFDLKLEDGKLLSQKLSNMKSIQVEAKPPKLKPAITEDKSVTLKNEDTDNKKTTSVIESVESKPSYSKQQKQEIEYTVQKSKEIHSSVTEEVYVPVTFDDMDWFKPETGKNDYICYTINDLSDITLISLDEDSIKHMVPISILDLTEETPFVPNEMEMCMVSYKAPEEEEESWYRAVVLSIDGEEFKLFCVDFGNHVTVKKDSIRKFPEDMKSIPILGISCACIGIPHNDKVLNSLKELIQEGSQQEVDIKEYSESEFKYKIEFPTIYKLLDKDGQCN